MFSRDCSEPRVISGRYRLVTALGRGGVGAVYRALDEATGNAVALKLLEHPDPQLLTSFEREYHTLASLRHPSAIEVYDYGITETGERYYTMQLLPGEELFALAPLPVEQVCVHLSDIATSLALLHARRLLHRDVSPRNVRLDAAGRAKLIDFGALSGFGPAAVIVGTPPCMAPEAVDGLDLDQRSDLFSLGVLAYFGLTRRMPFEARKLDEVKAAQRKAPPRPSELLPAIAPELDRLILSLLSLDRLQRPSSAAEVIDRLSAIANLDGASSREVSYSCMRAPALVGRDRACQQLERQLTRAERGRGGTQLLEGAAGMGRTRLAQEFVIEARLLGMAAVRVNALAHAEPAAALRVLVRGVLEAAPVESRDALAPLGMDGAALLRGMTGRFSAVQDASARLARADASKETPIGNEFVAFMLGVAAKKPLAVLVDDAHALDSESARALALLAHAARRAPLALLFTTASGVAAPALQSLGRIGMRVTLQGLESADIEALVDSVFGDVPHRVRLSRWLLSAGRGNPGQSLELLTNLFERGLVRYAGGTWVLPAELPEHDLPKSIEDTLADRMARLDDVQRTLLRCLALHRGVLSLPVCVNLLESASEQKVRDSLEQLAAQDLVVRTEDAYRCGRHATREHVTRGMSSSDLHDVHKRLADALVTRHASLVERIEKGQFQRLSSHELGMLLEIGFHLQCSGRKERGIKVLRDAAAELTVRGDGLMDAVPTLEAAYALIAQTGTDALAAAPVLVPLTLAGTYSDYRLSYRYGEETLELLLDAMGMTRARRLERYLGGRLALFVSLALAYLTFHFTQRFKLSRSFRESLLAVVAVGSGLLGTYSVMFDRERARSVGERLEPLRHFPRKHPLRLVHRLHTALVHAAYGEAGGAASQAMSLLKDLDAPSARRTIPADALQQLRVGCLTPSSLALAQRVDGSAQTTFRALDQLQTSVSRQIAAGARTVYYGHRGERAKQARWREEMDMLASVEGSTWRQDVGTPRQLWTTYVLAEDILGLKRCAHDLDAVAEEVESIRTIRDLARACYLAERGKPAEALAQYGAVFERELGTGSLMAARCAGAYARILRTAGDPQRARDVCALALSELEPEQLQYTLSVLGAQLELALCTSLLGDAASARGQLDQLARSHGDHDNPLVHGLMHKTRAQIALHSGDMATFVRELSEMERWFRETENPSLMAQTQRLSKDLHAPPTAGDARASIGDGLRDPHTSDLGLSFRECKSVQERLQVAVDLVQGRSGAEHVYLYLMSRGTPQFAAPARAQEPPDSVLSEISSCLEQLLSASGGAVDDFVTLVEQPRELDGFGRYVVYPLFFRETSTLCVVGAVVLMSDAGSLTMPESTFLQALARALRAGEAWDLFMGEPDPGKTAKERAHARRG